jgi:hypothetical protein
MPCLALAFIIYRVNHYEMSELRERIPEVEKTSNEHRSDQGRIKGRAGRAAARDSNL